MLRATGRSSRRAVHEIRAIRRWKLYRMMHPCWQYYIEYSPYQYHRCGDGAGRGKTNPPSNYRRLWRRQARSRNKRELERCRDYDTLQQFQPAKLTNIFDWY